MLRSRVQGACKYNCAWLYSQAQLVLLPRFPTSLHLVYQYNATCTAATRCLYCVYKAFVVWLQDACSVATRCLQRGYKMLAVWLQSFCSVAARCLQCGNKAFVVWQQGFCSVATNMVVVNHQPVVVLQDGSKSQKGASLSYCLFLAF